MAGARMVVAASVGAGLLGVYDVVAADGGVFRLVPVPDQLHTFLVVGLAAAVTIGTVVRHVDRVREPAADQDAVAAAGERGFELGRQYASSQPGLSLIRTGRTADE